MTDQPGDGADGGGPDATPTTSLVLEAPAPVAPVAPAQAEQALDIEPGATAAIDALVDAYLDEVTAMDVHGADFGRRVEDVRTLAHADIRASAQVSNTLLAKPLAALKDSGIGQASSVSKSLLELRRTVEDLDPSAQGNLLSGRKLLGVLPFGGGNRVRDYFGKYRSSQTHLNRIIRALESGQEELRRDNAAIAAEQQRLWEINGRLRRYLYLGHQLDARLVRRIAEVEATDAARADVLRGDLLFAVRQKVEDLSTQLAVGVQGYLALDLVRRNNFELIKGVDRATTTTVSALRTAVIVAQALGDQKLVLDQISALNATTANLIEGTSVLLREQSGRVAEQASSAAVDLATLQAAFANIYATIDQIDSFKREALDNMGKTVSALDGELAKAQPYLDRARPSDEPQRSGSLTLR
jgi:uncharacterized protein YaaN involved in tellurite resistance